MAVVATAGHVDHGKSSLVRALTGTDPDRFEEEKRRGLTIDLGFAWTRLPSGADVAFVDVPGHVRFLKNMLAGVGAVDACLFVVAASEGWKPQSEEHLRILEVLGVRRGIVALTKTDLLDPTSIEAAELDLADHVAGSFLDGAPIVRVAVPEGGPAGGVDPLRQALDDLLASLPPRPDHGRPRLWVDRVFTARGAGTVVTGTLAGGGFAAGDAVVVGPAERPARIRAIQSLGRSVDRIGPGHRVALNLGGISRADVGRGDAVVAPGRWRLTSQFDASLHVLATVDHEVSRRGAYSLHLGSGEQPVRVRVLGGERIASGQAGRVRLYLRTALPLLPGDRYVLRESGRDETVGGGEVLDVAPVRPAARARPDRSVDRVIAERGWIDAGELEAVTGERRPRSLGRWVVAPGLLEARTAELRQEVESAGAAGLDVARLDERDRLVLELVPDVVTAAGRARVAGAADPLAGHPYVAALIAGGVAPPGPEGVDRGELREMLRRGLVVERDGIYFAPSAIDDAARTVARLLAEQPDGVAIATVRETFGITRKHAVPLLAELDARGITRRRGDVRIAGPRLPPPS
jgi:selenocysteine-specific elongation factor